ncbi:MAG: helix-turn-helix domain-containing protein [Chloroflexota bacterium]
MTLTVPEAAPRVGRDPSTVRRWIRQGRLKATRVGTRQFVDSQDIDELCDEVEVGVPESWKTMAGGRPMPNVVAALRRSREGH